MSLERVFIFGTTLISSLAWAIISTELQLNATVNTYVAAASNKSASVVIWKQKSEYFDPRRGQLVANHSSPSRVTLQLPGWAVLHRTIDH